MNLAVDIQMPEESLSFVHSRNIGLEGLQTEFLKSFLEVLEGHWVLGVHGAWGFSTQLDNFLKLDGRNEIRKNLGLFAKLLKLDEVDLIRLNSNVRVEHLP